MRRTAFIPLVLVALAACASTPIQRELQYAKAIVAANDATATALDFGVIKADTGAAIQQMTRAATQDLKRAITARRAGAPRNTVDRILALVEDALERAAVLLGEK